MRRLLFALALLLPGLAAAQVCGPRIGKLPSFTVVTRPTAATPTFSPAAGTYLPGQEVTISTTSGDGLIRLTTDGNDPTDATPGCGLRSCKVTLSTSQTIKAITSQSGTTSSAVASAAYTLSGPGTGPSYFADSVNGTDTGSNPCTSQATPCRSIARVLAVSPPANSTIWLKYGSKWREEITGLASGVSVKAYGTDLRPGIDNRPMLDASDVAPYANWSKTGGYTYVYQISWTVPAAMDRIAVWENDVRLTRVASIAAVDATAGTFYVADPPATGANTVYVRASDNASPASNGKQYELSKRNTGITGALGGSIVSIRARRQAGAGGSIISYFYAKDCLAEDGRKHNFWVNGTCEDCVARYHEPPQGGTFGGGTMFVTFPYPGLSPRGTGGAIYRRCQAIGESASSGTLGFYAHTSGGLDVLDRIVYDGCSASNLSAGFSSGGYVNYAVYHNVQTTNCISGIGSGPSMRLVVLGGFLRLPDGNAGTIVGVGPVAGTPALTIRGLSVFGSGSTSNWVSLPAGVTVDVSQSTFVHYGAQQFASNIYSQTGAASVSSTRNIFYGAVRSYEMNAASTLTASDYNLFRTGPNLETGGTAGSIMRVGGTDYANFTLYRAAYPALDANSVTTDPQFSGDPTRGDMSVASGSPANTIQAGSGYYGSCEADPTCASLWASYGINPL